MLLETNQQIEELIQMIRKEFNNATPEERSEFILLLHSIAEQSDNSLLATRVMEVLDELET